MKKTLIAGLVALTSIPTFANCLVEMQYQGSRLGQYSFEAPTCREAKRECMKTSKKMEREVMIVSRNSTEPFFLDNELTCVTLTNNPGNGGPGNGGPGNGGPGNGGPGNGGPGYEPLTVFGTIEGQVIDIAGYNVDEVYNKCLATVESYGLTKADDLEVSINNHKYVKKTTGSWWYGAESICNVIDSLMTPERLAPVIPSVYPITIVGKIEGRNINIQSAQSEAQAYNSCVETVKSLNITKADDLMVAINGHKYVRKTTGSWWYGANAICKVVDSLVPSRITPVMTNGSYDATGRIEGISFNFYGGNIEAIFNQCVEFVQQKGITRADDVSVSINGSRRQRYTTGSWWYSATEICNQVIR